MYYRLNSSVRYLIPGILSPTLLTASVWTHVQLPYADMRAIDNGLAIRIKRDFPIGRWDVSRIREFFLFFASVPTFNYPLRRWNISSATYINSMFAHTMFNQPIDSWNTSSVVQMSSAFYESKFNQPIESWCMSSVLRMNYMFAGNRCFNQPLQRWDVSNVTEASYAFAYTLSFNQPLNQWDTPALQFVDGMFKDALQFNQPLDSWNMSNVVSMNNMFCNARAFNQPIMSWNVSPTVNFDFFLYMASHFNQPVWPALHTAKHALDGAVRFCQPIPDGVSMPNYHQTPDRNQTRSKRWQGVLCRRTSSPIRLSNIMREYVTIQVVTTTPMRNIHITFKSPTRKGFVQQMFDQYFITPLT